MVKTQNVNEILERDEPRHSAENIWEKDNQLLLPAETHKSALHLGEMAYRTRLPNTTFWGFSLLAGRLS